ncbi:MAG: CPBP family intramembrane metalloprotease [Chloroflexi bacterium]|nr:CPBP family intramembrane metalloprotease [Chloroflexota bacterium]
MSESRNVSVGVFFLAAYAWSWLFWMPEALVYRGISFPAPLESFFTGPFNPAAWGPTVAGFLLTYLNAGWPGVRALAKRGVDFGFSKAWYLVIFLLFPIVTGGAFLVAALAGEPIPPAEALANPVTIPIAFVYILLLAGPLQEEFGWRGYALDRLQARWNALVSSLILGAIWGFWHLPLFFVSESIYYQKPIWGLLLTSMFATVLFTWLYNNTGRSLAAILLIHTSMNWSHFLFPTLQTDLGSLWFLVFLFLAAITVLIFWGPTRLVRAGGSA